MAIKDAAGFPFRITDDGGDYVISGEGIDIKPFHWPISDLRVLTNGCFLIMGGTSAISTITQEEGW